MATPIRSPQGGKTASVTSLPPSSAHRRPDRRIQLEDVVKLMLADGLISPEQADELNRSGRHGRDNHPLVPIAGAKLHNRKPPHRALHIEWLTEWLAGKLGVEYMHIDPLKIDFAAVTQVISNAYAERYRILPVAVSKIELIVATSEPFIRAWADELESILHLRVKLVFANPVDIKRFLAEFYNLAKSVRKAAATQVEEQSITTNFEQLVELGQKGALDANDRHTVHIVDWLWNYAFEQRASDIHREPRRDNGVDGVRLARRLHEAEQLPRPR